jgi:hypothetical protein
MSDLVKRLRESPWCQPMKREAATRIEALEKAGDALADAMEHGRMSSDLVTAWDAVRREQAANK